MANQQKQLSQWCKIQMDEAPTTTHSEEIEEMMAKELLEEEKAPQVMIGWGGLGRDREEKWEHCLFL